MYVLQFWDVEITNESTLHLSVSSQNGNQKNDIKKCNTQKEERKMEDNCGSTEPEDCLRGRISCLFE
jgi:hypothetical protein